MADVRIEVRENRTVVTTAGSELIKPLIEQRVDATLATVTAGLEAAVAADAATATSAATQAAASADAAAGAHADILDFAAGSPEAASIVDKQARTHTKVDSLPELTAGLALGDPKVLLREDVTLASTLAIANSVHIEGATDDVEVTKTSGKIYEIEPQAVLAGTLAAALPHGSTTITLADTPPAGLVAGVIVDLGDDAHARLVMSVDAGAKEFTVNYPTGRAMAKGETINYRQPLDRVIVTRHTIKKAGGSGANITVKYARDVDLSRLTSTDCAGNAITIYHSGWGHLQGRITLPNLTARACQFGVFLYNCENANPQNLLGKTWTEYLLQFKDCRDCSGDNIHGIATDGGAQVANIKCSSLHPVWNVHLNGVRGTDCSEFAASLTHLRKEGTYFEPFNISASNIRGKDCGGLQVYADYGSKWDRPTASDVAALGGQALSVAGHVPPGDFYNARGVRSTNRTLDVESSGHTFIGGSSTDACFGGSSGCDIRLTSPDEPAIGRIEFSDLPAHNSTITLNGKTITFKSSGAVAANHECNIGATVAATLVNLAGPAGAGASSNTGLLNESVDPLLTVATYTAWTAALQIEYDTAGSAGDAYTLAVGAGSNATIYSFDGAATITLKGGTTTGATDCIFIGWKGHVTHSDAGVIRFVEENKSTCNRNLFLNCRIEDEVGKYTTDYVIQGAASKAIAPDWDIVPSLVTRARRRPTIENIGRIGNGSYTYVVGESANTLIWDTAITASRSLTMPTTGVHEGTEVTVLRTASGAFNLNVAGGLAFLAQGQGCRIKFVNGAWVCSARFPLTPDTGWTTGTGTALKGAIATYAAGAAITAPSGGATIDAESRTAIGTLITRMAAVEAALQNESQRRLALEQALIRAGAINGTTSAGTVA